MDLSFHKRLTSCCFDLVNPTNPLLINQQGYRVLPHLLRMMKSLDDRKRLLDALTAGNHQDKGECFAWGTQFDSIEKTPFKIESLYIDNLKKDIPVPVTLLNFQTLALAARQAALQTQLNQFNLKNHNNSNTSLNINCKNVKISLPDSVRQSLSPHLITLFILNLMGANSGCVLDNNIEAHCGKLHLVKKGQSADFCSKTERKTGAFAIVAITLPVEGGHQGGRIDVHRRSGKKSFHFDSQSDKRSSLLAFFSDCRQVMEPITDGYMLVLVFHLVWTEGLKLGDMQVTFPSFIKTVDGVNSQLVSWADPSHLTESASDCISIDDDRLLNASSQETSDLGGSSLLLFPLDGKYDIQNLSFSCLRGQDHLLAQIFLSINYLDVHLGLVSQLVDDTMLDPSVDWESCSDWEHRTFHLTSWISSNNSVPLSEQLLLNLETQLVGNLSRIQSISNGKNEVTYHHIMLVIQPRHQSILRACRISLDAVLCHLEHKSARLIIQPDNRLIVRQQVLFTLRHVLTFCRINPLLVWLDPSPATDERSRRLLKLCLQLRAELLGFDLLELLSTNVETGGSACGATRKIPKLFCEGIRNEKVAEAVADFVSQVDDWDSCSKLLMSLISPFLIFRQLFCYTKLALCLLERVCTDGARLVGDRITSILCKLTEPQTNFLNIDQLKSFIHMILVMESNVFTADASRMNSIMTLFGNLKIQRKILLVTDLQSSSVGLPTKDVEPHHKLLSRLSSQLATCDFTSISSSEEVFSLLKIYFELEDGELLQTVLSQLLIDQNKLIGDKPIMLSVLSWPAILEVAESPELGRGAIYKMLEMGVNYLAGLFSSTSLGAPDDECQTGDGARSYLASCFHLMIKVVENPSMDDFEISWLSIGFSLFHLPTSRLCDLIMDVYPLLRRLNPGGNPASYSLYVDLCKLLTFRDKEAIAKLSKETIIQVLNCFVMTEDLDLGCWLIQQISFSGSVSCWDSQEKNTILDIVLSNPDLLDNLFPASSIFVSSTMDAIMEAWVMKIVHLMDGMESQETTCLTDELELESQINWCVELFLRNEKDWPHTIRYGVELFNPLIEKLSSWQLCQLLVNIYQRESSVPSLLFDHPNCFCFCCFMAHQLVMRDLTSLLKSPTDSVVNIMVDVMICLLWLGDNESSVVMAQKISRSCPAWHENLIVSKIVSSPVARKMAKNSESNRKAFCLLLEQRINRLKMMKVRETPVGELKTFQQGTENASNIFTQLEEMRMLYRALQDLSEILQ